MSLRQYERTLTDWNTARKYAQTVIDLHTDDSYSHDEFTQDWSTIEESPEHAVISFVFAAAEAYTHNPPLTPQTTTPDKQTAAHSCELSAWLAEIPPEAFTSYADSLEKVQEAADESDSSNNPLTQTITRWVQQKEFTLTDDASLAGWVEAQRLASRVIDAYDASPNPYENLTDIWPSGVTMPPKHALTFYFEHGSENTQARRNTVAKLIQTYDKTGELPEEINEEEKSIERELREATRSDTSAETREKAIEIADKLAKQFYDTGIGYVFDPQEHNVELPSKTTIIKECNDTTGEDRKEWVTNMALQVIDWLHGDIDRPSSPYNPYPQNKQGTD